MIVGSHPGADLAASAIGAQHRHDEIGRFLEEHLCAVIAGAGDERFLHARIPQHLDGVGRRHHRPGIVTVVDVGVDDRPPFLRADHTSLENEGECQEDNAHADNLAVNAGAWWRSALG
jgi:hypothetical protein